MMKQDPTQERDTIEAGNRSSEKSDDCKMDIDDELMAKNLGGTVAMEPAFPASEESLEESTKHANIAKTTSDNPVMDDAKIKFESATPKSKNHGNGKKSSPRRVGVKRKKSVAEMSSDEEDFAGFDECNGDSVERTHKKIKEEIASDVDNLTVPAADTTATSEILDLPAKIEMPGAIDKKKPPDVIAEPAEKAIETIRVEKKPPPQVILPATSQKQQRSIKDEIYRKPFAFGWKREVVYRAAPGASKDKGEVYYITPAGKKFRTRTELQLNLPPELTIENFTFAREPIGMSAEEEMIRVAKATVRSMPVDTPLGKRVPKPKAPKGASPPPQGWTSVKAVKSSTGSRSLPDDITDGGKIQPIVKSASKSSKSQKKGEPCTIECVLAMGTIPQLQCTKCLCLYHHECMGVDRNNESNRIGGGGTNLLNTLGTPKSGGAGRYVCEYCQNRTPPKQQHQQKLSALQDSSATKSKAISPRQSSTHDIGLIHSRDFEPLREKLKSQKLLSTAATTATAGGINKSSTTSSSNAGVKQNINDSENLPQSIAVVKGRKYVVIRKPNAVQRHDRQSTKQSMAENSPGNLSAVSLTTGEEKHGRKQGANVRSSISSENLYSMETGVLAGRNQTMDSFANHFFGNVSIGYNILLHTFQYLKVQELLRAACVCRVWNVAANHRSLWKTVRMKNSQVNDWTGLSAALKRNGTQHLDLRKMISSTNSEEMWSSFSKNIREVETLETIDLCRCSSRIVEALFVSNPKLKVINALAIKDDTFNLTNVDRLINVRELRLKSIDGFSLDSTLSGLSELKNLKHLSLTSVRDLGSKDVMVLGDLINLESLDLGECNDLPASFATDVLLKLVNLERLRLEKGQENCCTLEILDAVAQLNQLHQLELVNFDIKTGFDEKLSKCKNLKRLLLIPTYISQSATTNNIVLSAVLNLSDSLQFLTWVVTLELLRVTALYVDQCDNKKKDKKFFDESIPVLKPVPGIYDEADKAQKAASDVPQVEILPLVRVEEILIAGMPNAKFKILKVPYHATWRQNLVDI